MSFLKSSNFPNGKTSNSRKSPTKEELQDILRDDSSLFAPVHLEFLSADFFLGDTEADGIIRADWKDKTATYVYEYKSYSTPNSVRMAIDRLRSIELPSGRLPLVIVPYLNPSQLEMLDDIGISGIDLCGNGLLLSSEYRIWRSGYPNVYKDSRPIRNPFAGDSSVFARCFLLQREFASLSELRMFAMRKASVVDTESGQQAVGDGFEALQGTYSLGTASKVVTTLEEELVVRKDGQAIILQDVRRLLFLLRQRQSPQMRKTLDGKTSLTTEEIWSRLAELRRDSDGHRAVATGMASAGYHKVLSGIDNLSLYVDNLQAAQGVLEVRPGKAFANITLIEDTKNAVYFDARREGVAVWASPIQTWLELTAAGPREREAALELESLWIQGAEKHPT